MSVPQKIISVVEKQFFFHTVRLVYLTAPADARKTRRAAKGGAEPSTVVEKPLGPNVTTVVNSGTIAEGAADVIGAIKAHAREHVQFPPANITLPVMRSVQKEARDYLTEEVLPGLQTAVKALSLLGEKPRNPYLWIADYLEKDTLSGGSINGDAGGDDGIMTSDDVIRAEPVSHVLDAPEDIQGVANFRRSKKNPRVYAVHQPTTEGVRAVVEQLCAEHGTCVWINMRDTPVVYVNGAPYTIQNKAKPDQEALSVKQACVSTGGELSALERALVKQLVTKANEAGGKLDLLPHGEDKDLAPVATLVPQDSVSTLQGVFDALEAEGFSLSLHRCLFCQDGAPEPEEIDVLVNAVRAAGDKAAIVFQCSSGVERSQLGMVLASLMFAIDSNTKAKGFVDPVSGPECPDYKDKAQYAGIIDLCQHLPEGPLCKALVDDVIDENQSLFNLRKMIHAAAQSEQGTKSEAVCMGMDHLERYWYLICFGAYLKKQVTDKFQQSFSTWLRSKRGVRRSLHKLCLV